MKIVVLVLSNIDRLLLILLGGIWILQGLNVPGAPGSFMTGRPEWTLFGAILVALEVLLIFVSSRRRG
jgi:hypothetical protein